jgi:hypothetical protein
MSFGKESRTGASSFEPVNRSGSLYRSRDHLLRLVKVLQKKLNIWEIYDSVSVLVWFSKYCQALPSKYGRYC